MLISKRERLLRLINVHWKYYYGITVTKLNSTNNFHCLFKTCFKSRLYIFSAIEELKGISRVAVLTEDQEIKVKEYFVSQHEFKKLEYKKKVLKVCFCV